MEDFSSHDGDSHFDWDYFLDAISELEGGSSPIGVLGAVLYAQRTLGNSFGQAPIALSNHALMILSSVWFITSV